MKLGKFNWLPWAGFVLTILAFLSYPLIFVWWPVTRDFPWASLLIFGVAAVLLFFGLKRAFAPDRRRISKVAATILTGLSLLALGVFLFSILIMAKWLPPSPGAPQVGQKAPDFSLADTNGRQVSLAELLSTPIDGQPTSSSPKGVLLIFYRGYW